MKPVAKPDNTERERQDELLKRVWEKPIGKIGIVAVSIVGTTLFVGALFKVGAFTMGAYKDFRDANRR